jgi:hypothetical protein
MQLARANACPRCADGESGWAMAEADTRAAARISIILRMNISIDDARYPFACDGNIDRRQKPRIYCDGSRIPAAKAMRTRSDRLAASILVIKFAR